ncbi:MAG: hypothetical protein VX312_03945 [Bacteroidota bacterium]|nr:hypothetical protein [Bacteroidota bacterium]MEE3097783.1 hypothetical protein [Bacteroidota bacterium]
MVLFSLTTHAQKIDKVRKVDKDKVELTEDELSKKKNYIIKLINLGYNDKTIQLKTRASKKQIKAIRKETLY